MSRLSDELVLSEDQVAQFTDTLTEIANQTIPKSHISKNKLSKVKKKKKNEDDLKTKQIELEELRRKRMEEVLT